MAELESTRSLVHDPSYDSFTLFLPEDERKRRSQRKKMLVLGLIVGVFVACIVGLLAWEGGGGAEGGNSGGGKYGFVGQDGELEHDMVSFMVVGSWGCATNCPEFPTADTDQLSVSQTMTRYAKRDARTAFVVSTGDNFYEKGVRSDRDPLWKTVYTDRFGGIGLPWYAVLGNHDWFGQSRAQFSSCTADGCPDVPPEWNMPFYNYSIVRPAGGGATMQLVFIDTFILSEGYSRNLMKQKAEIGVLQPDDLDFFDSWEKERRQRKLEQLRWLDETLGASAADWLFVVGHYPVFSGGEHGDTRELVTDIKPLLERHKVDVYFSGHDHTLQHLQWAGVDYVVSGGGSLRGAVGLGAYRETQFGVAQTGFALVQAEPDRVQVSLIGGQGGLLYHYQRNRRRNVGGKGQTDVTNGGSAVSAAAQRLADKAAVQENSKDRHIMKGLTQMPRLMACVKSCEAQHPPTEEELQCVSTAHKSCWTACQSKCLETWKDLKG